MIKGIGIDIVEIERIKKALNRRKNFLDKIFTVEEKEYISNRQNNINTIAGMFAAKEAISKALGTGIRGFNWIDLVISHDDLGKPCVVLEGEAKKLALNKDIKKVHISITHSNKDAVAYAIAEGFDENSKDLKEKEIEQKNVIDIFSEGSIIDKEIVIDILPLRKSESHKGTYGRVGIIAGSLGMTGASYLTTQSALRSGSGLVYTITPKNISHIMEIKTTEAIVKPVEDVGKGHFTVESIEDIKKIINDLDVIALGPGFGVDDEREEVIREILKYSDIPIILDGDGLNCIKNHKEYLTNRAGETIITPHPGELSRLLNKSIQEIQDNRIQSAKTASETFGVITVLKGANTIISDENGNIYINTTGNPGMATAGSGDVLTGIITSLVGQNINPIHSSIAGVYLHGVAGDLVAQKKGTYGTIASDIVEELPYAIKTLGGL